MQGLICNSAQQKRFLIVEDERDIARLLEMHLREFPAEVTTCSNGAEALALAMKEHWDVMILDLQLPVLNGIDICRALRDVNSRLPIIVLTSRTTEQDRILGLETGADDYMTKPFSVMELVARVRALVRRSEYRPEEPTQGQSLLVIGELFIDTRTHQASLAGKSLDLTSKEFELLGFFARQPGQVFTRSQLLDQVWGYGHDGYEHTVNSHINRLRSKLAEAGAAKATDKSCLETVWGVGYRLNPDRIES